MRKVWRACSGGAAEFYAFFFEGQENACYVVVEAVVPAVGVADGEAGVFGAGLFEGWGDVGVDPEWPEGIVEIEDNEFW